MMIDIVAQQVWLMPGATDMRKSIDGLAALARYAIQQDRCRGIFSFSAAVTAAG